MKSFLNIKVIALGFAAITAIGFFCHGMTSSPEEESEPKLQAKKPPISLLVEDQGDRIHYGFKDTFQGKEVFMNMWIEIRAIPGPSQSFLYAGGQHVSEDSSGSAGTYLDEDFVRRCCGIPKGKITGLIFSLYTKERDSKGPARLEETLLLPYPFE